MNIQLSKMRDSGAMDYGDPRLPDRFWDKVYPCPVTGCWLWGAAHHDTLPYGIWRVAERNERAHVSLFLAAGGEINAAAPHVLHSCDQPPCVRPEHLRSGTPTENSADAKQRNRMRLGNRSALTSSQVAQLRQRYADGEDCASLSEEFKISGPAISMIVRGLRWPNAGGPRTFGRHAKPSPRDERPICGSGHSMADDDNVRLKPNKACRTGFERVCRTCQREQNPRSAALRRVTRAEKNRSES